VAKLGLPPMSDKKNGIYGRKLHALHKHTLTSTHAIVFLHPMAHRWINSFIFAVKFPSIGKTTV